MPNGPQPLGAGGDVGPGRGSAIGRVILSIEIEDLTRPQLTLVDIPGLIDAEIKGVS
jgi:hypothetical protein